MFKAVGHQVIYLKRLRMGPLVLDERLQPGEYRELTEKELQRLGRGYGDDH
jgi:16S rRNA pseudouridine516 synthase